MCDQQHSISPTHLTKRLKGVREKRGFISKYCVNTYSLPNSSQKHCNSLPLTSHIPTTKHQLKCCYFELSSSRVWTAPAGSWEGLQHPWGNGVCLLRAMYLSNTEVPEYQNETMQLVTQSVPCARLILACARHKLHCSPKSCQGCTVHKYPLCKPKHYNMPVSISRGGLCGTCPWNTQDNRTSRWKDTTLIKKYSVSLASSLVKYVHLITMSKHGAFIYTDMYSMSQRSALTLKHLSLEF